MGRKKDPGDLLLPFVGRVRELDAIRRLNEGQMYLPLFIYGPEGCGKSRLFIEALRIFRSWYGDGDAFYINSRARDASEILMIASRWVSKEDLAAMLREIGLSALPESAGRVARVLIDHAIPLAKHYLRIRRVKRIFIVYDELVRSIGVRSVSSYAKALQNAMDLDLRGEEFRDKIINVAALTSEGESRGELSRHSYVSLTYIWNLPREDYEELYHRAREIYGYGESIEIPGFDEIWRLYGGNPRRLWELVRNHRWNIESHLKEIYGKHLLEVTLRLKSRGLLERIRKTIEDPDSLLKDPGPLKTLERFNLVSWVVGEGFGGVKPRVDKEAGVGSFFAWQIPVYRDMLEVIIERGSLDIDPGEVARAVLRR